MSGTVLHGVVDPLRRVGRPREIISVSTSSRGQGDPKPSADHAGAGSRVLTLATPSPDGAPRVEVPGLGAVSARCLRSVDGAALRRDDAAGREVLVYFDGDASRPVIVGVLEDPVDRLMEHVPTGGAAPEARIDGSRVVLEGQEEVSLVCGEASITLRRDGLITLKGVNVSSEAGELQRIRGAVVKIN